MRFFFFFSFFNSPMRTKTSLSVQVLPSTRFFNFLNVRSILLCYFCFYRV
ncbi:hypothetical protein RchiOBHm_Chr5g0006441 [Rosa chinensis]|uniref:Uncharacterized protein n=1 Tax=Rosa chinensis TaxID=74649 RepID=A0A2P6Q3J2_ROSCH|nr:hypothetical protein RchiOBHm_Chr5g0006441 [Rosa chinensis]